MGNKEREYIARRRRFCREMVFRPAEPDVVCKRVQASECVGESGLKYRHQLDKKWMFRWPSVAGSPWISEGRTLLSEGGSWFDGAWRGADGRYVLFEAKGKLTAGDVRTRTPRAQSDGKKKPEENTLEKKLKHWSEASSADTWKWATKHGVPDGLSEGVWRKIDRPHAVDLVICCSSVTSDGLTAVRELRKRDWGELKIGTMEIWSLRTPIEGGAGVSTVVHVLPIPPEGA